MSLAGRGSVALLLCATGCSETPGSNNQLQQAPGLTVTVESENAVAGSRPTLTLTCGPGAASFTVGLPYVRPDPTGVTGLFKLDEGPPLRTPLLPLGNSQWAPRLSHLAEAGLVRNMAAARNIYFAGPEGATDLVIRWDLSRLGARAAEVRAACAFTPAPP